MKQPNVGDNPMLWIDLEQTRGALDVLFALRDLKDQVERSGETNLFVQLSAISPSLPNEILDKILAPTKEAFLGQIDSLIQEHLKNALGWIKEVASYVEESSGDL